MADRTEIYISVQLKRSERKETPATYYPFR